MQCCDALIEPLQKEASASKQPTADARLASKTTSAIHVSTAVARPLDVTRDYKGDMSSENLQNRFPKPRVPRTIFDRQDGFKMTAIPPPTETP